MQPYIDAVRTQMNSAGICSKDNSGSMWGVLFSACHGKGSTHTPVFPALEGRSGRGKAGRQPSHLGKMVNGHIFSGISVSKRQLRIARAVICDGGESEG